MLLPILVFIQSIATVATFSVHHKITVTRTFKTELNYHPETFERAVDCANNYGMCNVDELLNLADGMCACTSACLV